MDIDKKAIKRKEDLAAATAVTRPRTSPKLGTEVDAQLVLEIGKLTLEHDKTLRQHSAALNHT
eukprot:443593-Heterocapsa_arctica.AAC.1